MRTDITLLTSMVEHPEPSSIAGGQVTRLSVGGDPDAAAIVDAVAVDDHSTVLARFARSRS